ncbi:YitT family protein [Camelliibacillus cellulosilyticus]|uniref:YitT family protein n=1 Tax=Camelliibacillus cellulosilyticus TaxID=2174486 RepID=A0ABV9GKI2_9BACL
MRKILSVFCGSILLSIGIDGFIVPYHLLDGGMIGIGLIVNYLSGIKPGLAMILLSAPIYVFAWFFYRQYFYNSIHGLLISSFFIDLMAPVKDFLHFPPLPSAVIGGLLIGTGIGLMLLVQVSTGGTDLLAQFIAQKTPINVGIVIFLIDAVVLFVGFRMIGVHLFFSALTICCVAVMTSFITSWPLIKDKIKPKI